MNNLKNKGIYKHFAGVMHVKMTFNNIIITVNNSYGTVITSVSAGQLGFKGGKKSTPYAAKMTTQQAAQKALEFGIKRTRLLINGPGYGRDNVIRAIKDANISIDLIRDVTPIPHNGCRPPKKRRV